MSLKEFIISKSSSALFLQGSHRLDRFVGKVRFERSAKEKSQCTHQDHLKSDIVLPINTISLVLCGLKWKHTEYDQCDKEKEETDRKQKQVNSSISSWIFIVYFFVLLLFSLSGSLQKVIRDGKNVGSCDNRETVKGCQITLISFVTRFVEKDRQSVTKTDVQSVKQSWVDQEKFAWKMTV